MNSFGMSEWVSVLKDQISEIHSIYSPEPGSALQNGDSEKLILAIADLIPKAKSQEEARFYVLALTTMVQYLIKNHTDVLSAKTIAEKMFNITRRYQQATRDLSHSTKMTIAELGSLAVNKSDYRNLMNSLLEKFINDSQELRKEFKEIAPKDRILAIKKIDLLTEKAKQIQASIRYLEVASSLTAEETLKYLATVVHTQIDDFFKISHTHTLDLLTHELKDVAQPTHLQTFFETFGAIEKEISSLDKLGVSAEEALDMVGSLLTVVVPGSGEISAGASEALNLLQRGMTSTQVGLDIHEGIKNEKYKLPCAYILGGLGIATTVLLCPPTLPFILAGLSAGSALTGLGKYSQRWGTYLLNQRAQQNANLQEAQKIIHSFFTHLKTDCDQQWQQIQKNSALKQNILEHKDGANYQKEVQSVLTQQTSFFAKNLSGGNSHLNRELKNVRGYTLIFQKKVNITKHIPAIVSALYKKCSQPGELAKILNKPPRDCLNKLKVELLDGPSKLFNLKMLEAFVNHLHACKIKAEEDSLSTSPGSVNP